MLGLLIWSCWCGFIGGSLGGRYLGVHAGRLALFHTFLSLIIALVLFITLFKQNSQTFGYSLIFFSWIKFGMFNINWSISLDSLNITMACIVTLISTLVHFYSLEYMGQDPHLPRFMSYLSLFTFFMLILITGNNFVQMFVGWEGVGISSYLLINFWLTRLQANKAAFKAMVFNKLADAFMLLAFCFIFAATKSLDYDIIFSISNLLTNTQFYFIDQNYALLDIVCLFLFLGAMGKSAQIGFHNWLPDAMEGPTPVSALIHAATMVTAGVFLVARCSYLFELAPTALAFVSIIGAITALFGATVGLFSHDLKRVIAFSTCSQLGYMMLACGLSQYEAALFHLATHAVFKALLFLTAGSVIHSLHDEQDMRKMGGLLVKTPIAYVCFGVGSLNLMGIPFLSGFYSKDLILELIYSANTTTGLFAYILGGVAAFFTAAYSTRVAILVFLNTPNFNQSTSNTVSENGSIIKRVLLILSVFSIFFGGVMLETFAGIANTFFSVAIYVEPNFYNGGDAEFIPSFIKIVPIMLVFSGIVFSILLYKVLGPALANLKFTGFCKFFYQFLIKKWYTDRSVNQIIGLPFIKWSRNYTYYSVDRGLIELFGPTGLVAIVKNASGSISHRKCATFFNNNNNEAF